MPTKAQIEKELKKLTSEVTRIKQFKPVAVDTSTLEHGDARKIINTYISEYIVTEDFVTKTRLYASQEIDSKILSILKSIAGVALGTAIALLVTFLITGKFN